MLHDKPRNINARTIFPHTFDNVLIADIWRHRYHHIFHNAQVLGVRGDGERSH